MAESLKTFVVKRSQIIYGLTRLKRYIDSDIQQLRFYYPKLEQCWSEFDTVPSEIDITDDSETQLTEREEFENIYFDLLTALKLPAITIPTFSGQNDEWLNFCDKFQSLIHNNTYLSDIQIFHYFISSLQGNTADVIEVLDISAQNITITWNLRRERFENKTVLGSRHVSAMFNLPKVERESATYLRLLFDIVNIHLQAHKMLSQPAEGWDTPLINLITKNPTIQQHENGKPHHQLLLQQCHRLEAVYMCRSHRMTGQNCIPRGPITVTYRHYASAVSYIASHYVK
ncbi:hypothetical protein PR048_016234 [Dryococelus australis]|uniref:Uncharacterized protein n=1 Tax=Dryococelus australis TaxID=614101 RepID=A0ABQ9HJG2_9NEOP|nr:hypothetical protein PR048_016234 [Dryococelus australis]